MRPGSFEASASVMSANSFFDFALTGFLATSALAVAVAVRAVVISRLVCSGSFLNTEGVRRCGGPGTQGSRIDLGQHGGSLHAHPVRAPRSGGGVSRVA